MEVGIAGWVVYGVIAAVAIWMLILIPQSIAKSRIQYTDNVSADPANRSLLSKIFKVTDSDAAKANIPDPDEDPVITKEDVARHGILGLKNLTGK